MPAPGLSRVDRVLYRTLQKLARTLDRHPALKALICRNVGSPLPPALDSVVARFLGSPDALYYWPAPVGQPQGRVADAVRQAFRQPPPGSEQEGAFAATRYLSGLLAIARKHGMLSDDRQGLVVAARAAALAARSGDPQQAQRLVGSIISAEASSSGSSESASSSSSAGSNAEASSSSSSSSESSSLEVVSAPERGNVLIAHPALSGIFGRSVVLLCSHEPHKGSYGLIVNKPLGSDLQHLYERLDQLQGSGGSPPASGAFGGLGAGGPSALFGQGGQAAPGAGGALLGGSGEQEGMAAAAAAAASGEEDEDIPAESLQQMADYLDWRSRLGLAAPAAAAAQHQQPPEFDEYGNWLEPSSFESFDQDSAAEEAGPFGLSDSDDETRRAFQEGLAASALGEEWSFGPGADPEGVADALMEALRRAGGGTVVMCDSEGQLWSHHLPSDMATSEDEDEDLSSGSEGEGDPFTSWVTAASLVDEGPEAIADLILASLTPQDRLLLQRQAELAAEVKQLPAGMAICGALSSDASSSGGGGGSPEHPVKKVQRIQQVVDHLVASASAQLRQRAAAEQQQQGKEQQQQGEEQPAGLQQQQHHHHITLNQLALIAASSAEAGRLAVGGLAGRAGESVLGGSAGAAGTAGAAGAAGTAGEPSDSSAKGGTAHTVTQLMGLFKASPLFRGGPVPGVQVLHRRPKLGGMLCYIQPKLGGMLALPPWGCSGATAEAAVATAIAVEDAAAGAGQPGGEALEGGLFVGADLTRAQELLDSGYLSSSDVRVVLGDSAWVPQQLEGEVARGTWAVARVTPDFLDLFSAVPPAVQPALPAEGSPGSPLGTMFAALDRSAAAVSSRIYEDRMWGKCLSALGPECAALASVPRGVWQDIERLEI
ncbi:transcriptional regulator isoform C [Chlorella sorokiniana]|uniref:Transcriptional regulator isoform C n=1 Tax=Chlorella sorokiniana TaxID=3076 RepID=A0A2P6TJE6_CHLSO|nr:transcriptional regulator isoform C [Chlorella sorokiniana]|eukprot:PRW39376.1 transcriptional regulator isoform C [Chlorella sorokiniana]